MANMSLLGSIAMLFAVISVSVQQQDDLGSYWRFNKKLARQYQPAPQPMPTQAPYGGGGGNQNQGGITLPENLITGISFDCTGKPTGPNRDTKYCDIFHACVYGQQQKTYACPQIGDRFFFDQATQRCQPSNSNPAGCQSNNYYQQMSMPTAAQANYGNNNPTTSNFFTLPPTMPITNAPMTQPPYGGGNNNNNMNNNMNNNNNNNGQQQQVEPWKLYVRNAEQFSCSGKQDGFFPSRWCNVFYRCFAGTKFEFLCAKAVSGDRTWWIKHSTSQSVPQPTAQCVYPCDDGRQCTSPGGVLKDDAPVSESTSDAQRIISSCPTNQGGNNGGGSGQIIADNSNDIFRLPETENPCSGLPDGTQLPSKYCNAFYVCFAGFRKDQRCAKASNLPYDLFYNEQTRVCEWPCKVQCSKPIFGSSSSASQVQAQDASINVALCGGGGGNNNNNNNGGNNNNNNNNYNMPTNPITFPTNPPTYPTNPPTYPTYPTNAPTFPTYPTNPPTYPTYPTYQTTQNMNPYGK